MFRGESFANFFYTSGFFTTGRKHYKIKAILLNKLVLEDLLYNIVPGIIEKVASYDVPDRVEKISRLDFDSRGYLALGIFGLLGAIVGYETYINIKNYYKNKGSKSDKLM
jgi:hypothetical protein